MYNLSIIMADLSEVKQCSTYIFINPKCWGVGAECTENRSGCNFSRTRYSSNGCILGFYGALEFSQLGLPFFLITALVCDGWVLPECYLFVSHQWFYSVFSATIVCLLCPSNSSNSGFFLRDFSHIQAAMLVFFFFKALI